MRTSIVAYGVPVLAVLVACLLLAMMEAYWNYSTPVPLFIIAVIVSTWLGGTRSGVFATALALVSFAYLYMAKAPGPLQVVRLTTFLAVTSFVVWLMARQRRTAEAFRQALDAIPVMAWSIRPDGRLDFLNRRWLDYAGYTLEQAIADPISAIHPDDRQQAMELWQRNMASGESYEQEIRLRRADGEYRWFLVRTVALRDDEEKILHWYGTSTDIEDRRRAERATQESREALRQVLATLPVGVAVTDRDGNLVMSNDAVKRIWGGDIIVSGTERWERSTGFWHGSGKKIEPGEWASVRALSTGEISLNELIDIVSYDGSTRKTMQNSAAPIRDSQGQIVGSVAVNEDVTERVRAQEALRDVIETIPAIAWTARSDGTNDYTNRSWHAYTGLSVDDTTGTGWQTVVHPDDVERHAGKWLSATRSGDPFENEARYRRAADGEYRWFLVRAVPLRDEQGRILRWYGMLADIEDRKRGEQALRDSAERLQQLSRRLLKVQEEERRHLSRELHDEFGQVLAAISLHLQAAKNAAGESAQPSLDQCMSLLQYAGTQMRALALELRPTMLETAGLDASLRWMVEQYQQRTNIVIQVAGHAGEVSGETAIAGFRAVQEALTNVVRHAQAGRVWIEVGRGENSLDVEIRDDGDGFDVPATLEQAGQEGHLGLLGMRERVEILGGKLDLDSRPGDGTRIQVSLPLA